MQNDAASNYTEKAILDHMLGTAAWTMPSQCYLALHTANPTDAASGAEVTGGSYQRQPVDFDPAITDVNGNTTAKNNNDCVYSNMPNGTVTHFSVWDQASGGHMLISAPLDAPKTQSAGDQLKLPTGQLTAQVK